MEEWKEYRLGDIITISSGFPYKGEFIGCGDNYILGMGCVSYKETFLPSGMRSYSSNSPERYLAYPGDIVLATRQQSDNMPILGMPAIIPNSCSGKNLIIGANLYKVQNNSEFSNSFLFWLLKSPTYVQHIKSCQTGSTVRMITKANIENFYFYAPQKEERNKISNFLWNIERKIELNRQINDNLEQQAQALFKSWFVDFEPFKDGEFVDSELGMIPKGWRVGNIFDIANIFDSQRKPLSSGQREKMDKIYPYYGATSCMDYVDNYIFDGIYTLIGEDGSVVRDNGLPFVQYVWGKFWVNNHAHILQGKNGFSTEMIYTFLSTTNICHLVTGAVQAKLSQANMNKLYLPIPPENLVEKIKCIFDEIFKNKRLLIEEINTLTNIRDTLLPRLMSGELKINEINC